MDTANQRLKKLKTLGAGDEQCADCLLYFGVRSMRVCRQCIAAAPAFTEAIAKVMQEVKTDGEIYEAFSRRANPEAHAKIDELIASLPKERVCCGTFTGSPHRATCAKYRGKLKPSNLNSTTRQCP